MKPSELFKEYARKRGLYNIMPISNIRSVLEHGILSNKLANRILHQSVAMAEVQERRDNIEIPNGRKLHRYANLYFDARNPMMYLRKAEDICVLNIMPEILDFEGVVISDCNAASRYARFYEASEAFTHLDYDLIYARDWRDDDLFKYQKKKSVKCAEALIPERIAPEFISSAAVKTAADKKRLCELGFTGQIFIVPDLFFQKGG
ncbi:MAG: DUF4433 domain-containing protein [Oscillospiraceae bacterium]|nr:DUF4433 domain-containing protein [Oscillospiraceae bacterium]